MKPQRSIYLLVAILMTTTSCLNGQSKAAMFEDQLQGYKVTLAYKLVQEAAAKDLQRWISDNLEEVELLKECTWKVDDAVFFNTKKDRCYLLLLIQDNAKEAEIDYVYQMYAALEDGKWKTYFSALPNYVYLRERLNLPKYTSVPMETLSRLARQEMLKGYYGSNRTIDDNFVDKTYTPFLKERHVKFLNKKDN